MKVVFLSNFYNHHQEELCERFDAETKGNFLFVETGIIDAERKAMGWGREKRPKYIVSLAGNEDVIRDKILSSDIVIVGNAPIELVKQRLQSNKLVFIYSERLFKNKRVVKPILLSLKKYTPYKKKKIYCLCASAFASEDYNKLGLFKGKCYKWGYFPKYEDLSSSYKNESNESVRLIWVSRFIDWKHPEIPVNIAERLSADKIPFSLTMVGSGDLKDNTESIIKEKKLQKYITIYSGLSPVEVRQKMKESDIFLITSDRGEGWGAVLNEAMNSKCTVVSSSMVGAAPYLIKHNTNGVIYQDGDFEDLYKKIRWLIDNPEVRRRLSSAAYQSIKNSWNAELAVKRLITLADYLMHNAKSSPFSEGICSIAERIDDEWFNSLQIQND